MLFSVGIDLGGTRIKGILLDGNNQILHQIYTPTQDGDDRVWKKAVFDTVSELEKVTQTKVSLVGISAPGIPNESNTAIACMPGRLQGLEQFDWAAYLQKKTYILNDAISALVAEARMGMAVDKKNVALLTLGTGVGGALLINGQPYQGAFQKAGHVGHMCVDYQSSPDVTGMPGSLEDCIGNCTIWQRSKGKYNSTHELLNDYRKGDTFAAEIWLLSVRQLAIGIASVCNIVSPELVILGGGITEAGDDLFTPLKQFMKLYEWRPSGSGVSIVKAKFGDLAGAIGAACFAREKEIALH